ncbi:caspase family protein [Larkinella rosea]|uniref:Peptidase C14 caspase domain-containing protein n=1 Tax=Larkinella rosea TaxID=2025312 RepID=A0A3P1BGA6_9BACT|nr:caspase family protein [Larkinella rosea]RRB00105.1 hypothetical protein EHT25_26135 [Larkinella rosea]
MRFICYLSLVSFVCLLGLRAHGQAKLHFIVFADTDDTSLGEANRKTYNYLTNDFGPHAAQYAGLALEMSTYSGNRCRAAELDQKLASLNVGNDDVVLFYFIGHGWNNRTNEYPSLIFGNAGADRATLETSSRNLMAVYEQIRAKHPRLALVIGEACNKERNDDPPVTSKREAIPMKPVTPDPAKYKWLFRNYAGSLIMSSCKRNQFSFSDPKGGWLGVSLHTTFDNLLGVTAKGMPSWESVVKMTTEQTEAAAVKNNQKQNPQHIMAIVPFKGNGNDNPPPPPPPPGDGPCPPVDSYVNETALAGIREDLPFLRKMDEEISTDNAAQFAKTFDTFYKNQKNFYDSLNKMLFYESAEMPPRCQASFQQDTRWVKNSTTEIIRRYQIVVKLSKEPQQLVAQARSELPSLILRLEEILKKLDK